MYFMVVSLQTCADVLNTVVPLYPKQTDAVQMAVGFPWGQMSLWQLYLVCTHLGWSLWMVRQDCLFINKKSRGGPLRLAVSRIYPGFQWLVCQWGSYPIESRNLSVTILYVKVYYREENLFSWYIWCRVFVYFKETIHIFSKIIPFLPLFSPGDKPNFTCIEWGRRECGYIGVTPCPPNNGAL